jgi:hypothetical protein
MVIVASGQGPAGERPAGVSPPRGFALGNNPGAEDVGQSGNLLIMHRRPETARKR